MNIGISNYNVPPCFTGYKSVFSKELEKHLKNNKYTTADRNELLNEFTNMYSKKVNMNTKIGSGFYGTVYKIDDHYVLKRGNERLTPEFSKIEIVKKTKFTSLKHYFGEAIARITNKNGEDMIIMKNVYSKGKSLPAGIPEEFAKTHTKEECLKYYNEVYLPTFARLSQKSFDAIAKDFAELNKMCKSRKSYFFDYINPNNFVLCGKTLRILDDINEERYIKTKNCVSDMFDVFINCMYMDSSAVFDTKLIPLRSELIKKIILAGVRHKVPMCQNETDYFAWFKAFDLLDIDLSKSMIKNITETLDTFVAENKNPKKRIEIAKQYLEDILGL